ncbi:MAG TPA: histidine kinase [Pseudolysinimonas sp.]|jgi:signal transduction histidine kinase|nr:histidine kinase [Pseudolysinimonas sp.]
MNRLRSVWNAPAASPAPPKRVWRDWVLVVVLPLLVVFEALVRHDVPFVLPAAIIAIAVVPTLLWRRTHPLLMFVIAFASTGAFQLVTGHEIQLYSIVFLLLLVYSLFRWGSGHALVIGGVVMLTTTLLSTLPPPFVLEDLIGAFAIVLFTITIALLFRFRAGSRMRELDRAKSHEREELARDLHDTVAHHVSAIAIQAQAGLARAGTNPEAATAALRVIEAEASRTLTEMRAMVRVLRRDEGMELAPAAKVTDLKLLAASESGGPLVVVQLAGDVDELPAPVGAAVYRIAQESVTNARRHARNVSRIEVHVEADGTRVRLSVHDDGATAASATPGYGVTGMRERAELLGGALTAGPAEAGGWTVAADLPRDGVA